MGSIDRDSSSGTYRLAPQYHSQLQKIRVICAGAGAAVLLVAYKLQKYSTNYELVCYDKNSSIGGTWFENRYPGCACDLPAHAYVLPFEPNPDWSQFYATGPEILEYFEKFADKYNLRPFIRLNSRIEKIRWDEAKRIYDVELKLEEEIKKDWYHVSINGTGFLNDWKWPDIPGLHDFDGALMHSAAWDTSVNPKDKTIAVIGTGSSAIQIVPEVQKSAKHVTAFMRSPTWIYPSIASDILAKVKGESEQHLSRDDQYRYAEEEKKQFREHPETLMQHRLDIEVRANDSYDIFLRNSSKLAELKRSMIQNMVDRIGPNHDELKSFIIPKWNPGYMFTIASLYTTTDHIIGRRVTPGPGYLEALTKPIHTTISGIVKECVIDSCGKLHRVDIIVCVTGFNIAFAPRFQVVGRDGVTMADEFKPEPKVYLAMAIPKFPNYFVVNGPRGNWATGNVLVSQDIQVENMVKCIERMQNEGIKSMEIRSEPIDELYEHIGENPKPLEMRIVQIANRSDEYHRQHVWSEDCNSWYKSAGKVWIWGGTVFHYFKTIKDVRWEDYVYKYKSRNRWAYLGNGWTEAQCKHDRSRLAP